MTALDATEADALLTALKRRPIFRKHPQFVEAFNQLNFKRFIADASMEGADWVRLAKRCGGAIALALQEPPPGLAAMITEVLEDGQTFFVMCDTAERRAQIAEGVEMRYRRALAGGGDIDGQHRLVGILGRSLSP